MKNKKKSLKNKEKTKIKAIEDLGKQMVESNELIKKILISTEIKKKIFSRLVEEKSYEFNNLK